MQGGKSRTKGVKPQIKGCNPPSQRWDPPVEGAGSRRGSRSVPGGRGWSPVPGSRPASRRIWASSSCWRRWGRGRRPRAPRRPGDSPGTGTPGISGAGCPGRAWSAEGGMSPLLLGPDRSLGITWGNFGMIGGGGGEVWDNPGETLG